MRGATRSEQLEVPSGSFLLTRLLRGATLQFYEEKDNLWVSTHTPLARRDITEGKSYDMNVVSTHTPLARRDEIALQGIGKLIGFYSHASCEARLPAKQTWISG